MRSVALFRGINVGGRRKVAMADLRRAAGETRDELAPARRHLYLRCPDGYGRTKLSNASLEKKLGVAATTRDWRTVTHLNEMARTNAGWPPTRLRPPASPTLGTVPSAGALLCSTRCTPRRVRLGL